MAPPKNTGDAASARRAAAFAAEELPEGGFIYVDAERARREADKAAA
jgi:hypothetical protein